MTERRELLFGLQIWISLSFHNEKDHIYFKFSLSLLSNANRIPRPGRLQGGAGNLLRFYSIRIIG
mgnify:CR=1 FL=1